MNYKVLVILIISLFIIGLIFCSYEAISRKNKTIKSNAYDDPEKKKVNIILVLQNKPINPLHSELSTDLHNILKKPNTMSSYNNRYNLQDQNYPTF